MVYKGDVSMLKGIPVSAGFAIGHAVVMRKSVAEIPRRLVSNPAAEIQRLSLAIAEAKKQLGLIRHETAERMGQDQAGILDAQLLILDDPELMSLVHSRILDENENPEYALQKAGLHYQTILEQMEDPYLRERAVDIKDAVERVIRILQGLAFHSVTELSGECILVVDELTPSDTAQLNQEKIFGLITDYGGPTSHMAIMARSLGIPAVVGTKNATQSIKTGDLLIVDSVNGQIILNPDLELLNKYSYNQAQFNQNRQSSFEMRHAETVTKDGRRIQLFGNIGHPQDAVRVMENGADGIGLYRTEFLYMEQNGLPSEEKQFVAYKKVLEQTNGKPVIIRTLDIGGDKQLGCLCLPGELNPSLGYRALRICLDCPDIFKTQLRAILRASVYGDLRVMFPMVSSLEELRQAKHFMNEVFQELTKDGLSFRKDIEVGVMIEIPSAAIISDILAREVDFFSLGTNDLVQYTLAVDRTNEKVAALYNPLNPAVLRLIRLVVNNAHQAGKWVGICGEMASDNRVIPVLLGLGLDELSVNMNSIIQVKQLLRSLDFQQLQVLIQDVFSFVTGVEVEEYLNKMISS
jgi:phosphotransferase system enzyme I (PtsI)